jgi:hypothetical protein
MVAMSTFFMDEFSCLEYGRTGGHANAPLEYSNILKFLRQTNCEPFSLTKIPPDLLPGKPARRQPASPLESFMGPPRLTPLTLALLCAFSGAASASADETTLSAVTVSAKGYASADLETPISTTTLDRNEIARRGAGNVDDALHGEPGIAVSNDSAQVHGELVAVRLPPLLTAHRRPLAAARIAGPLWLVGWLAGACTSFIPGARSPGHGRMADRAATKRAAEPKPGFASASWHIPLAQPLQIVAPDRVLTALRP